MIKILLVDDEYAQRIYLKKIIDWSAFGCDIVGEAADGNEALAKITELKPHIVFLDVDMPCMNGIELLKIIDTQHENVKTVIVSGHTNFGYARDSIKFGVKYYLLKPLDEDELLEVLHKIIDEINQEKKDKFELSVLYEKLNESIPLLREKFLHDLVSGKIQTDPEYFNEKTQLLDIPLKGDSFITAVIELDDIQNSLKNEKNRQILKIALMNICEETLKIENNYVIFNDTADKITLIIPSEKKTRKNAIELLEKIKQNIFDETNITVTIGCGESYRLNNINKSYEQSLYLLKSKNFQGYNCILDYTQCQTMDESYISLSYQYREQLLLYLRHKELEPLKQLIDTILQDCENKRITIDYMRILSIEILTVGITYLATIGCTVSKVYGEGYNPLEELMRYNSLIGLKNYTLTFFKDIYDYTQKLNMPKLNLVISRAKQYIDENYINSHLSLEIIATELFVHPVYLCSLFKKEVHKTISQYIVEIRMKNAMDLIKKETDLNVTNIASLSGYENPYYFSKVFKKYYGASPSAIIKNH